MYRPREPIKPTEVGDAAKRPNPDKTQVNKGRICIQRVSPPWGQVRGQGKMSSYNELCP